MAKKKKKAIAKKKIKTKLKDPRIQEIREEVVWFNCPVRGRISQKVKVKRYKSLIEQTHSKYVLDSKDPLDKIDVQDDGLSIYNDGEELGITGENE